MKNKVQKIFWIGNILLFICAIICLVCYDIYGGLWLKGVTSSWFVILGFVNLIYARKMKIKVPRFLILMELGFFFGMCADVLLGVLCIIFPIAVISLFIVTGTPYIRIKDPFIEKLLLVYAVIIACMLGKAISNLCLNKSIARKLILLGSAMFWFSDVMLAIDMFGESSRLTWVLCSYTYWPAQNILALSLFHFINEQSQ